MTKCLKVRTLLKSGRTFEKWGISAKSVTPFDFPQKKKGPGSVCKLFFFIF